MLLHRYWEADTQAARLDGAQGLDGADERAALGYDAVGGIGDGHLKIPATRFGSGGGVDCLLSTWILADRITNRSSWSSKAIPRFL
jgi:hypothetical protein